MAARSIDALERLPAGIGYVRVRGCAPDLATAFFDAVRRLDAEALIVDLRRNPGGDLDAAVRLGRDLLPEDATVVTMVEPDGEATVVKARGAAVAVPIVLLVDGGTASAAEVLTAALRGHRRALVVGERTFGKGKAWRLGPEGPVTAATCLGPDGRELGAIEPDLPGGADALRTAWAAAVHLVSALGHRP
jgi:carboxyl-terminal processing protease